MSIHDAYLHEQQNSKTIVIFIHGFMGSPNQFKQMASAAESLGFSVSVMLLPGHGDTIVEFNKSGRRKWEAAVYEHIGEMSKKYSNVILVGHSMGALLAFSSYKYFSNFIKGIVAFAAPLSIVVMPRSIKTSFRVVFDKTREDNERDKAAESFCSVEGKPVWAYIKSLPRYFDLFYLKSSAKKTVGQIEAPTLVIHSVDDEVANIKGVKILEKKLKHVQVLKLYQSGHYYYSAGDTQAYTKEFAGFLKGIS